MFETLHSDVIRVYDGVKNCLLDMAAKNNDEQLFDICGQLEIAVTNLSRKKRLEDLPSGEIGVYVIYLDDARNLAKSLQDLRDKNLSAVGQAMVDLLEENPNLVKENPARYLNAFHLIGYDVRCLPLFGNGSARH